MSAIFWVSFGLLWALVLVQGFAFLEALRQIAQLRTRLGPHQGALIIPGAVDTGGPLPELVALRATDGKAAHWEDYLSSTLGVIVVVRSGCSSCRSVASDLTGFAAEVRNEASVMVLVEGTPDYVAVFVQSTGLDPRLVAIDEGGRMARDMGTTFSPGAVTVLAGRIGVAAIVNDVDQVHALLHADPNKDEYQKLPTTSTNALEALARQGRVPSDVPYQS